MEHSVISTVLILFIALTLLVLFITLLILIIKVLLKYLRSGETRQEEAAIKRTLSETLREHRLRCSLTQEFVAEAIGVSRQAVSKWENGSAVPSTTKLCALAKLYGVDAGELLRGIDESFF